LLVFLQNNGRTLEKEEMIEQIWPDRFVEDGNLTRNISTLRKDSALAPERFDWWMTSLSEESATRTKAFEHFYRHWWPERGDPLHSAAFTQMQITGIGNHTPHAWVPGENAIIFSVKVGDSINLWKIGFTKISRASNRGWNHQLHAMVHA
jgi:hypothetical protein